jgi:hypothetical protein
MAITMNTPGSGHFLGARRRRRRFLGSMPLYRVTCSLVPLPPPPPPGPISPAVPATFPRALEVISIGGALASSSRTEIELDTAPRARPGAIALVCVRAETTEWGIGRRSRLAIRERHFLLTNGHFSTDGRDNFTPPAIIRFCPIR